MMSHTTHSAYSRRAVLKGLVCSAAVLTTLPLVPAHAAGGKTLVLFFSHSGNTRKLAAMIHERVGGDMVELKTVDAYPQDYDTVVKQAKKEQEAKARPALATQLPGLEGYGTVFLGYPNWWGTMPMPLFTLLEKHDFSGKSLIPFCTHGGSRLGRSVEDIRKCCPGAKVLKGFAAFGNRVDEAGGDVDAWLHGLGISTAK
jgi:flavodoxin